MKKVLFIILFPFIIWLSLVSIDLFMSKPILNFVKEIRGTTHLEGETKANELVFVYTYLFFPAVFLVFNCAAYFYKRR